MEGEFRKVVEQIFNNWTALILAVEHSYSGSNYKEVVSEFMDYLVQYCLHTPNVDSGGIQEVLDDIMDQEFDTVCEDNSTKEISVMLQQFGDLVKQGDTAKFQEEYQKLPVNSTCRFKNVENVQIDIPEEITERIQNTAADTFQDVQMKENSDWIQVKSKRKH